MRTRRGHALEHAIARASACDRALLGCFGPRDRGWTRRPVFGTARCTSAPGLERRFDVGRYLKRVAELGG